MEGLSSFLYSADEAVKMKKLLSKPGFPYDFNSFNKSRVDLIKESIRIFPEYQRSLDSSENNVFAYLMRVVLQAPTTIHQVMFIKCI